MRSGSPMVRPPSIDISNDAERDQLPLDWLTVTGHDDNMLPITIGGSHGSFPQA